MFQFLDAKASPGSYPCQSVSESIIVSDLEIASPSFKLHGSDLIFQANPTVAFGGDPFSPLTNFVDVYYDHCDDDDKEEENAVTYFSSNCVDVFPDAAISTNLLIDSLSDGTFLT